MDRVIKILSIDDDEFIRVLLGDIFWVHGRGRCEFYVVENTKKAEEFILKNKPDLIFLDLMLHENGSNENDSLFFLKRIKDDPAMKSIKVIILSGYPEEDLKIKALEMGAEKFLTKGEYLPKELVQIAEESMGQ